MFYAGQTWSPSGDMATSPTYAAWRGPTGEASGEAGGGESTGPSGAALYRTSCASCHQGNGQGVPGVFPPLAGDPVVTARDPTRHISTVLYGLQGRTIDGTDYATRMPAWADQLSDQEVAAVVNHERTSWGNEAPTATAEQVARIREAGPDSTDTGADSP